VRPSGAVMSQDITKEFKNWEYSGTQGGQAEDGNGGFTEFSGEKEGMYGKHGYGFTGQRGGGFTGGIKKGRMPLPEQDEVMPKEVASVVQRNEKAMDELPGVLVPQEDGSLKKVAAPGAQVKMPVVKLDPTRYDKSVEGILKGRNAAMFVNVECKKRGWEIEFEQVDAEGPVHDRTYSYTLTIGPPDSEEILVTAGIAKGKKEAKRRCAEAMVLKVDDLPPPLPPHLQPHNPYYQMMFRGGRGGRWGRGGGRWGRGGFQPRPPPPESEETVFKKYDTTPSTPHPSQSHPISKLCEMVRSKGWPQPEWDLCEEKVIERKTNKHGAHNTMMYTYKCTIFPGKGTVEPKYFFGSGPTKKDAKFACGGVAWANMEAGMPEAVAGMPAKKTSPVKPDIPDPTAAGYNPLQMVVDKVADVNARERGAGDDVKSTWLETVKKSQKEDLLASFPKELRPPTQLVARKFTEEEQKAFDKIEAKRGKERDLPALERDRFTGAKKPIEKRSRSKSESKDRDSRSKSKDQEEGKKKRKSRFGLTVGEELAQQFEEEFNKTNIKKEESNQSKDEKEDKKEDKKEDGENEKEGDKDEEKGGSKTAEETTAEVKEEDIKKEREDTPEDGEIKEGASRSNSESRSKRARSRSREKKSKKEKRDKSEERDKRKGERRSREKDDKRSSSSSRRRSRSKERRDREEDRKERSQKERDREDRSHRDRDRDREKEGDKSRPDRDREHREKNKEERSHRDKDRKDRNRDEERSRRDKDKDERSHRDKDDYRGKDDHKSSRDKDRDDHRDRDRDDRKEKKRHRDDDRDRDEERREKRSHRDSRDEAVDRKHYREGEEEPAPAGGLTTAQRICQERDRRYNREQEYEVATRSGQERQERHYHRDEDTAPAPRSYYDQAGVDQGHPKEMQQVEDPARRAEEAELDEAEALRAELLRRLRAGQERQQQQEYQ